MGKVPRRGNTMLEIVEERTIMSQFFAKLKGERMKICLVIRTYWRWDKLFLFTVWTQPLKKSPIPKCHLSMFTVILPDLWVTPAHCVFISITRHSIPPSTFAILCLPNQPIAVFLLSTTFILNINHIASFCTIIKLPIHGIMDLYCLCDTLSISYIDWTVGCVTAATVNVWLLHLGVKALRVRGIDYIFCEVMEIYFLHCSQIWGYSLQVAIFTDTLFLFTN